jgi:hypothetical protein
MNPRIVTLVAGSLILGLGLLGLLYPERVMGILGFAVLTMDRAPGVLGEVRATFGGVFVVMGIFALLAAVDPHLHRTRLRFIGLMWLGACGGRLLGVFLDGGPGLFGWLFVAFEAAVGGALVVAAQARQPVAPPLPEPVPTPASLP